MVFAFEHNNNTNQFVFGKDMTLPWGHIPKDLELFKEYTMDKGEYELPPVLVMGYKTYESIKDKGIKGREFWVLSTKDNEDGENVKFFKDIDDLKNMAIEREGNVFIIGGKFLLESFMGIAQELSVSYILKRIPSEGNVFLEHDMIKDMLIKYKIKEKKLYKSDDNPKNANKLDWSFVRMRLELK